ncbi:type IX secretion system outer membrane channel protein PorV [uncultured Mucilaginibacter sp.]|uniref:type IX secretion system outer membrane channel protein PorV n=1 Tax=uncultured Mucilaginibacter sp. TaxID=797541 RepID=UPI0025D99900|nr:type IX secretion system outer membrane channel protein PorV [uncultured Mucilaginibacter sp.]
MMFFSTRALIIFSGILCPVLAIAQTTGPNVDGTTYNTSSLAAVPFLNITPDSRSGALGEAGVALTADVNANYWNPAKLAFLEDNDNVSLSYSPWLRQLVPDISMSYLSYAHKIDDRNTFGASLKYFNYGTIQFRDNTQNDLGTYSPNEFALNGSFARKFGEEFSLALTAGFIYSNLSNAVFATGTGAQARAGTAVAAGVALYYNHKIQEFGTDAIFAFGTNISNIGSKISYSNNGPKYFLPANLKIGVANTINLDDYNQLTFTADFNKLLVPTPPITDANGNIVKGVSNDVSVPVGIFQSFSDAPGGFKQELQQITISTGLEYWYNQQFAVRAGYFYENPNNGGSHYLTMGIGFKYDIFNFDFSYLAASQQNSPLANTLRFTLSANFGGDKNAKKQ